METSVYLFAMVINSLYVFGYVSKRRENGLLGSYLSTVGYLCNGVKESFDAVSAIMTRKLDSIGFRKQRVHIRVR